MKRFKIVILSVAGVAALILAQALWAQAQKDLPTRRISKGTAVDCDGTTQGLIGREQNQK